MFYFNCVTRVARYPHVVSGVPGLDFCYDCRAEVEILRNFLLTVRGMAVDDSDLHDAIRRFSLECVLRNGYVYCLGLILTLFLPLYASVSTFSIFVSLLRTLTLALRH